MSNIISNGFSPHMQKEAGSTKVLHLGTPHAHPFAAGLPEGATIAKRDDGAVIVKVPSATRTDKDGKAVASGPDFTEVRVDSPADRDHIIRGNVPWYVPMLDANAKTTAKVTK